MLESSDIIATFVDRGYSFYAGVPCSFIKPLINRVIGCERLKYVAASSEGEAVALAAGSFLAGRLAVVMLQNSGLGNIVNPLTSLTNIYKIPCLVLISLRGQPGVKDAVQHTIMGAITPALLETLNVRYAMLPAQREAFDGAFDGLDAYMRKSQLPAAFVLPKGGIAEYNPTFSENGTGWTKGVVFNGADAPRSIIKRGDAICCFAECLDDRDLVISTTGKISRELFTCADRPGNFYMQGSMGCAAGIGLGLGLTQRKRVVVLDGDGAVLMKMGTLATIGSYQPQDFLHVILDNQSYDSTGGQPSTSPAVSFPDIAAACGYRRAVTAGDMDEFRHYYFAFRDENGPSLIHMTVAKGAASQLGRPTLTPEEIKRRFMEFVSAEEP